MTTMHKVTHTEQESSVRLTSLC